MGGAKRLINAEIVRRGVAKGKGLAKQLGREFSPERIARTKPEDQPKRKAKK